MLSNSPTPSSGAGYPLGSGQSRESTLQGESRDRSAANLNIRAGQQWSPDRKSAISGRLENEQATLRILQSATEFEQLRADWSAWASCPEADIDFFSIHLRHAYGVVRPHVLVVYRNGRADCMLVGWLHQGSVAFPVGSFPLFRSNARILRFVNGGLLGNQSRENSQFLLRELIRSLQEHEAQAVEFSQLRADSPLYHLARQQPSVFCREHFTPVQTHRYLTLPASFDEFLRSLSGKSRHQLRRHTRMLVRDFPAKVRFQIVRSECDVEDFARKADEISQKTSRRALGTGFVNNLETLETLRATARKATLRACVLYVDERPVAFASGILSNRTFYGTFTGYDPDFRKYRPGLQVLLRLIEESFQPSGQLLRIDAGCGDSPYKRMFFSSSWKESPVWIFAPSAKGLRLNLLRFASTLLHFFAMRLLAKSRHVRKIKQMWHRCSLQRFSTQMSSPRIR